MNNEKIKKIAKEISKTIPNASKDNVDALMGYALNAVFNSIVKSLKDVSFSEMSVKTRVGLIAFLILDVNEMISPIREILIGKLEVFNADSLAREIKAIPKDSSIRVKKKIKDGKTQIMTKVGIEVPQDDELEKLIKQASSSVLAKA